MKNSHSAPSHTYLFQDPYTYMKDSNSARSHTYTTYSKIPSLTWNIMKQSNSARSDAYLFQDPFTYMTHHETWQFSSESYLPIPRPLHWHETSWNKAIQLGVTPTYSKIPSLTWLIMKHSNSARSHTYLFQALFTYIHETKQFSSESYLPNPSSIHLHETSWNIASQLGVIPTYSKIPSLTWLIMKQSNSAPSHTYLFQDPFTYIHET